jgi:hypothetical protein
LEIDGKPIADFSVQQLEAGVNLGLLHTPMLDQAADLDWREQGKMKIDSARFTLEARCHLPRRPLKPSKLCVRRCNRSQPNNTKKPSRNHISLRLWPSNTPMAWKIIQAQEPIGQSTQSRVPMLSFTCDG